MKIELYLDGHRVEINDDIDFVLNRQFTELSDLTSIIVDYSKTISIPMTPTNNELFNNIYKLNRQVVLGTEYIDYDPSKRIPMTMTYNSSIVMDGYAILNKVNLKNKTYEINIYGQLGKIFSELKEKNIGSYNTSNVMMTPIKMNRNYVYQSWLNDSHGTAWTSYDWTDYFGFAPQMMGVETDFLSTTEYEDTEGNNEFKKFEDLLTGDLEGRKPLIQKGLDINQYGEIRSYTTRPYVYVDKLIQLIKYEINDHPKLYNDYRFLLDPDWFNNDNPYYSKMVYFPGQESMVTDERSVNGSLSLYDFSRQVFSFPSDVYPSVQSSELEGYSYTIEEGKYLSFQNEDGGMNGNISISGNNVRLVNVWKDVNFGQSDVWNIVFGMYNKNIQGFPVCYIGIYDEYDNLLYRICLVEEYIDDVVEDSGFLWHNWTHTTSGNLWTLLHKADERNIVPQTVNETKSLSGTTFTRTQVFSFPNIVLDTNKFKFKLGCMSVSGYSGTLLKDNLDYYNDTYYPRMFKNDKFKNLWGGTHGTVFYIPTLIEVTSSPHRSDSDISIVDILGSDFNPFTWMIDYVKKFRLFFDIDYLNKTILLTDRYFHGGNKINITDGYVTATIEPISKNDIDVDYSKEVVIEPLVNNYKAIKYNYAKNESIKGTQYKKKYGVEYGDLEVSTGINLNSEVMNLIPDEDESVMIPTVTNTFTWTSFLKPVSIQFKPSQLLKTNKIINTLDKDGKIQYFPFYCFRLDNVEFTYDNNTPDTDKIRISDDTPNQKNYAQYCYLSASDTSHQVVMNYIPQFDNYYVYGATNWALVSNGDDTPLRLMAVVPNTNLEQSLVGRNEISINTSGGLIRIVNDEVNFIDNGGNTRVIPHTVSSDGKFIISEQDLDVSGEAITKSGTGDLFIDVDSFVPYTPDDLTIVDLPVRGGMNVQTMAPSNLSDSVNYVYWGTFTKPKVVYNGNVETNIGNYAVYDRWRNYLNEIFNPNNKKVTCYVMMSYPEFINFKFNQLLVIDGSQFLVNKIIDFNPNSDEPTKVELIQIQDEYNLTNGVEQPEPPVEYVVYSTYDNLEYTYDGDGPTNISVWCYQGQARLNAPQSPWFNLVQTGSEPLYDTGYYKLIYSIDIATNTGDERSLELTAKIDGVSEDVFKKIIPVVQYEYEEPVDYGLQASPSSLSYGSSGGTQTINASANIPYKPIIVESYNWITVTDTTPSSTSSKTYSISVDENTGSESRTATIKAQIEDVPASEANIDITISQSGQTPPTPPTPEISASPDSLSFPQAGGTYRMVDVYHTAGYTPYIDLGDERDWIFAEQYSVTSDTYTTFRISVSSFYDFTRTATIYAKLQGVSDVDAPIEITQGMGFGLRASNDSGDSEDENEIIS